MGIVADEDEATRYACLEQSARLELENVGFRVRVVDESTMDPAEDGVVVGQTPRGGSRSDKGGLLTLTVARLG